MERRMRADLALAFCSLLWGATFVVVRGALDHISVFSVSGGALFAGGAVDGRFSAGRFAQFEEGRSIRRARPWVCSCLAGYAFQTAGLQYTTPAKSGFVTGSSVVLVPLLLAIFWKRRLTAWIYAGTFAAVAGLYLLTVPAEGLTRLNHGDLLTLGAAGLYAVHIILVGDYTRRHSVAALSLLQVAACAVLAWMTTAVAGATLWQPVRYEVRWELVAAIVICAVFATAIAFSVQLWAQQYTSSSHAAIIFTLEPVFAVITSYLVIGERSDRRSMVGAFFVLAGILIAELLGPAAAPESPEPMGETAPIG